MLSTSVLKLDLITEGILLTPEVAVHGVNVILDKRPHVIPSPKLQKSPPVVLVASQPYRIRAAIMLVAASGRHFCVPTVLFEHASSHDPFVGLLAGTIFVSRCAVVLEEVASTDPLKVRLENGPDAEFPRKDIAGSGLIPLGRGQAIILPGAGSAASNAAEEVLSLQIGEHQIWKMVLPVERSGTEPR